MLKQKPWLLYALLTTLFWGVWGAFIELPEKNGFPATLGYIVWSLTMIPCALVALHNAGWKLEVNRRAVMYGMLIGLTGAGGQLLLFEALRSGPAYIVFPFVSLYPVLTIALSVFFLKERANQKQWAGIIVSLAAIFFLSWQNPNDTHVQGLAWLALALMVFVAWAVQGYFLKVANEVMRAESIFFYMALASILLSPLAWMMTDFSRPINTGLNGPYLAAVIHLLNSIGALMLVYAFRYGKAIVVSPMTGLAPVLTILISLAVYGVVPGLMLATGILLACVAMWLLA